jgi:hypothetical protein
MAGNFEGGAPPPVLWHGLATRIAEKDLTEGRKVPKEFGDCLVAIFAPSVQVFF